MAHNKLITPQYTRYMHTPEFTQDYELSPQFNYKYSALKLGRYNPAQLICTDVYNLHSIIRKKDRNGHSHSIPSNR